jgi:hypothetical protein
MSRELCPSLWIGSIEELVCSTLLSSPGEEGPSYEQSLYLWITQREAKIVGELGIRSLGIATMDTIHSCDPLWGKPYTASLDKGEWDNGPIDPSSPLDRRIDLRGKAFLP